jgi:CheY-like chemotaxis protein
MMSGVKPSMILLVEDNEDDELLTLRALTRNNIKNEVVVARNGADALDFLFGTGAHAGRDLSVMPEVTLLDLKLPKISGLEVLRALRSNELTKLLPVVVLTSSLEEQDLIRSYGLGANSYVRKPVDFNQFTEAVRHLGLYWLILNEKPPTPRR